VIGLTKINAVDWRVVYTREIFGLSERGRWGIGKKGERERERDRERERERELSKAKYSESEGN